MSDEFNNKPKDAHSSSGIDTLKEIAELERQLEGQREYEKTLRDSIKDMEDAGEVGEDMKDDLEAQLGANLKRQGEIKRKLNMLKDSLPKFTN